MKKNRRDIFFAKSDYHTLLQNFYRSSRLLLVILLFLVVYGFFKNHQYAQLSQQHSLTTSMNFHDQFSEGKSCGLLTTKEASELLGVAVGTNGTVIASDSPTAASRPGSPRIDSCSHTAYKSSEGYIDLVLKTYDDKKDAAKYFNVDMTKIFPIETRTAGGLGQKLSFGSGAFYLLKDNQILEVSASKTPRIGAAETEAFSRSILEEVVAKL